MGSYANPCPRGLISLGPLELVSVSHQVIGYVVLSVGDQLTRWLCSYDTTRCWFCSSKKRKRLKVLVLVLFFRILASTLVPFFRVLVTSHLPDSFVPVG
jgi:hypothetical protein